MLVLYRFSTYPEVLNLDWSLDLNQGPKDYESSALTTELMARMDYNVTETHKKFNCLAVETIHGLDLSVRLEGKLTELNVALLVYTL